MERVEHGFLRPDWQIIVESEGLLYHSTTSAAGNSSPYWREDVSYRFFEPDIWDLVTYAERIDEMLALAGQRIIDSDDLMRRLQIPEFAWPEVRRSWYEEPPSILSRLDLAWSGSGPPRLLEVNADSTTMLIESAVCQLNWAAVAFPDLGQFNEIHDRLVQAWKRNMQQLATNTGRRPSLLHFAYNGREEDDPDFGYTLEEASNAAYLMATAAEAGYSGRLLPMQAMQWDIERDDYFDPEGEPIDVLYHIYPWEWAIEDSGGKTAVRNIASKNGTCWIEPIWKMVYTKGILPVMWEMFRNDSTFGELVLPAYFTDERPSSMTNYVLKSMVSGEGAGAKVVLNNELVEQVPGDFPEKTYIVQEYTELPQFKGREDDVRAVVGVFIVDNAPAGMGVRETRGHVTDHHRTAFVPHVVAA